MKKNKGFTLIEIIVAIVIVGIVGICVIQLSLHKIRIDKQTAQNIEISNKVIEIFNIFSADPSTFQQLYQDYYDETTGTYKVYFVSSQSSYYQLTYKDYLENNQYYQLDVEVIVAGIPYKVNDIEKWTRKIYYGG